MSTIRVLHVADLVNRYDFIDNVVRNLDPDRFWAGVCTLGLPPNICDPAYGASGIPHWEIPAPARRSYLTAGGRLARMLAREHIDLVHVHHYEPALVAWLATRLAPSTRLVVGRHYSDAIYLDSEGWRRRTLLMAEALVNRSASRVVVPSTMIRSLLVERQQVPARKVLVIPYGFEPARYAPPPSAEVAELRRSLNLDDCFVIGTFARLYRDKGHRYLVDALAGVRHSIPRLRWLVVGEGAERAAIEQEIDGRGLRDIVELLGWRSDVLKLMAAVDVVVQPTLQEAFSQAMAEALWMGRPLVMTDVSAARDVISDGETGLIVAPRDPSALSAAIVRLASDEHQREAMGRAAREEAKERLAIKSVIKQLRGRLPRRMRPVDNRHGGGQRRRRRIDALAQPPKVAASMTSVSPVTPPMRRGFSTKPIPYCFRCLQRLCHPRARAPSGTASSTFLSAATPMAMAMAPIP